MKKTLSLLLIIIMVCALFSACGGNGATSSTPTPTPGKSAAPTPGWTEEPDEGYVYKMPIAEGEKLSWWRIFTSTVLSSPAEVKGNIELEKRTGIKLEYKLVSQTDSKEQFNLMVVSGDYCDLIGTGRTGYVGGYDKAIEDGVFISLNEYIDRWAPNYKAMMDADEEVYRQCVTDSGTMGAFAGIQSGPQPAWIGPMMRQDWLDDLGLATPTTYDDWYTILKAFKDEKGADKPLSLYYLGYSETSHSLTAGYNVGPGFYNENGTIKYGFVEEGFRSYLEMMHKWYDEGLIDNEFFANNSFLPAANNNILTGRTGVFDHMYTYPSILKSMAEDPNFHLKAVPIPVQNAGDVAHFRRVNFEVGDASTALSTNLKTDARIELAVRWMDYRFSEEGSTLLNYGIENESYVINAAGTPEYMEVIYKNPEGTSFYDMRSQYIDNGGGTYYIWKAELITVSAEELEAYDIWGKSDGSWVLPPVTLTTEEGQEYSKIYGDIETYVHESALSFIIGNTSLDQFDSFVSHIKSLNIDRCIELYQNALTRYYAR